MTLNKAHNYLTLGLLFLVGIGYWYIQHLERQRDEAVNEQMVLDGRLNRLVDITGPLLVEKFHRKGKVVSRVRFVPPEGKTLVTVSKENKIETKVKNKGITFRPGLGVYYNSKTRAVLSTKVVYWGRLGGVVNVGQKGVALGVSRYVDDLIPLWNPRNIEIYVGYYVVHFTTEQDRLNIGFRITF